jgi:hypothetical protein
VRATLALVAVSASFLPACADPGCLTGDDGCIVPTPCAALAFTCDAGFTELRTLGPSDIATPPVGPGTIDTLAAPGDVLLANDHVAVVIEALDHPHYIAPTGGAIIDISTRTGGGEDDNDSLRHLFQAVGLLPGESVTYTSLETFDEGDVKAVQVIGTLAGFPEARVATRYEIRPCEPGIRIRTEILNGTPDSLSWFLTDAWYYGGRENLPFTPGPGAGFTHPSFGLSDILTAFRDAPYMVAGAHVAPAASYAEVSCDAGNGDVLSGFHAEEISTTGVGPQVVPPRDWMVFERFVAAAPGASVSAAADVALELRSQLYDEPWAELSGHVEAPGGTLGDTLRASVVVAEGTPGQPAEERIPWTQVLPDGDGDWTVRVPADRDYVLEVESFGQVSATGNVHVGAAATTADPLVTDAVGEVTLTATVDGADDHVLVFVVPGDDATDAATRGYMYGHFSECAPLLGNPHGPSPACNRVLVSGPTTVALPPGVYDFYAVAGPFSSLAAVEGVTVEAITGQSVDLALVSLTGVPGGFLSGDFHVHGGASFDSSIHDYDRVRAFLASRIDVIASTEHDVVSDYAAAMEALDAHDRLALITGTESTGHVLFQLRTDYGFPQVIGHWNFWPMPYDPTGPYRGAAWDELAEPGLLMTRQRDAGWDDEAGVVQLNHPIGGIQFGRDYSWGSAAGFDVTKPLKAQFDGTGQSLFFHQPEGAAFANSAYDVQEVMNGTNNGAYLQYRAFWFYLLDQGIVRGGTANSDSHSLTENVLGTPRSLVWTDTTVADFDLATFDADVRAGHVLGTDGPVVEIALDGDHGDPHVPGVEAFAPDPAAELQIRVLAAPWVPVDEIRIIVDGEVKQTLTDGITPTADAFGTAMETRYEGAVPLSQLVADDRDHWIVVEAGQALEPNQDLNCDGIPDTGDNNRDGTVDWRDVEELTEAPEADCFDTTGPFTEPPPPGRGDPSWYFAQVTPGGYPLAFTNPLLLDPSRDGFQGAGQ